jgi:hypothetical protein
MVGVDLDTPDAPELARFYARLRSAHLCEESAGRSRPSADAGYNLAFEAAENYARPFWPTEVGKPPTSMHLDIEVDDLEVAVAPQQEQGVIWRDPLEHRQDRTRGGRTHENAETPGPDWMSAMLLTRHGRWQNGPRQHLAAADPWRDALASPAQGYRAYLGRLPRAALVGTEDNRK